MFSTDNTDNMRTSRGQHMWDKLFAPPGTENSLTILNGWREYSSWLANYGANAIPCAYESLQRWKWIPLTSIPRYISWKSENRMKTVRPKADISRNENISEETPNIIFSCWTNVSYNLAHIAESIISVGQISDTSSDVLIYPHMF